MTTLACTRFHWALNARSVLRRWVRLSVHLLPLVTGLTRRFSLVWRALGALLASDFSYFTLTLAGSVLVHGFQSYPYSRANTLVPYPCVQSYTWIRVTFVPVPTHADTRYLNSRVLISVIVDTRCTVPVPTRTRTRIHRYTVPIVQRERLNEIHSVTKHNG